MDLSKTIRSDSFPFHDRHKELTGEVGVSTGWGTKNGHSGWETREWKNGELNDEGRFVEGWKWGKCKRGTTLPATQVWPMGVKAGLGAHDAGASGRQDLSRNSNGNRDDCRRQTTPRPTILGDPIVNTASKVNCVLMDLRGTVPR